MVTRQQRRRQLAWDKWHRQRQRRLERRRGARRRSIIAGVTIAVLAVAGIGTFIGFELSDDPATTAAEAQEPTDDPTPTPAPSPTEPGECVYVEEPDDDQVSVGLPPAEVDLSVPFKDVTIETNLGTIEAELFASTAACAVNSFEHLAAEGAFTDTICAELATEPAAERYLRCGDLTGSGAGGPDYIFATEDDPDRTTYEEGLLVLTGGEDRHGSQFLITYGKAQELDDAGTVFGKVRSGMDLVEKVVEDGLDESVTEESGGIGLPANPLVIEKVDIEDGAHR